MPQPIERHLLALPRGENRVYLSWRLLPQDGAQAAFHLERRRPAEGWQQITTTPITTSTDFVDTAPEAAIYEYRVRLADRVSHTVAVDAAAPASNLAAEFPLQRPPQIPLLRYAVGDLTNNDCLDVVIVESEGGTIRVCAYRLDGKLLWEIDTRLPDRGGWDGRTWHVPVLVWDINGDGRSEVVFHRGPGHTFADNFYNAAGPDETLLAVDGETGDVVWEVPWPARRPRLVFTLGYLNGFDHAPSIVVQDGTYGDEIITAIDGQTGRTQWQVSQTRPAGHNLDIADIDADGRQEVIVGGICYRGDGNILWATEPFGHTDVSKPAAYLPDQPGLQILYLVEKHNPGVYLVDSRGETIWHEPFGHAHWSWIGRYPVGGEALMIHAAEKGQLEYFPIYFPDGRRWREITHHQAHRWAAVGWEADGMTCFAHRKEKHIVRLDAAGEEHIIPNSTLPEGASFGRVQVCMDMLGDFRENFAAVDYERGTFFVAANPNPAGRRMLSPREDFAYRHERSQIGSGYYTYICPPQLTIP